MLPDLLGKGIELIGFGRAPFLPTRSPTVATTGLLSAIWGADPVTRNQSTACESTRDSDRVFLNFCQNCQSYLARTSSPSPCMFKSWS